MKQFQKQSQKQIQIFKQYQLKGLSLLNDSYADLTHHLKQEANTNPYLTISSSQKSKDLDWIKDKNDSLSKTEILNSFNLDVKNQQLKYIGALIIDNLDSRGFLTNYKDLLSKLPHSKYLIDKAIDIIQQNGPLGICARSVSECLLLQLKSKPKYPKYTKQIIRYYLDDIAEKNYKKILNNLHISKDKLKKSILFIRTLKPGISLSQSDENSIIVPELFVNYNSRKVSVHLIKDCQLNFDFTLPDYSTNDNEAIKFIKKQKRIANNLQKLYLNREKTLLLIGQAIVQKQKIFFTSKGRNVNPLTKTQIANEINLNISTVSRTVRSKYFQCDFGVFPLNILFSRKINSFSQKDILNFISNLISNESDSHPYTDDELRKIMQKHNINISRRTIVKYRSKLNIPNSFYRQRSLI